MQPLTFQENTRIEGIAISANSLLTQYAGVLNRKPRLPAKVREAHEFRMKVEHVSGALIDIAKHRARLLFSDNQEDSEGAILRRLWEDAEFTRILEALISLNGHQGIGHLVMRDIARLASRKPKIVAGVKEALERRVNRMADQCAREGRTAMDIVRHIPPATRQCLFSVH
jgi:hypothetical protein